MKRVLHPALQRGRLADSLAWLLLVAMLAVLAVSFVLGVRSLQLS
jgi:hypothetical protein